MNNIIHKFINHYQFKKNKINKNNSLIKNISLLNEIQIFVDINNDIANEKILFLNSKELSEKNTEIFINNEKYGFNQYFIPKKIGIYNISVRLNIKIKDCSYMFKGCKYIRMINLTNFNSENIIKMDYMFCDCQKLESINLFSFKTKNAIDMSHLFYNCKNLKYIDLFSFDTKNVINMNSMFYGCENLNYIEFSCLNAKKVSDMSNMFYNCMALNNLDLSHFYTEKVVDLSKMFYYCKNIENLNLSNFKTLNVNNTNNMFANCYKLKNIDLSQFNIINDIDMSKMFYGCRNLINLDLSSLNTKNFIITTNMFYNCINYPEFVIKFISKIKNKNITDYLFNTIKNLKYFEKNGDIIKLGEKIIVMKDNKNYVLNLINKNFGNKCNADCTIFEYDIYEENGFKDIESSLKKEININKKTFNYLIGINHKTESKIIKSEVRKFSNINKIKNICVSSEDDNDIKNLLNDILMNLNSNLKKIFEKKYIKIVLLGLNSEGVGKTSLIKRILNDSFDDYSPATVGFNKFEKMIKLKNGKELKLLIYDTSGKERILKAFLESNKYFACALLVYDITDRESFNELESLFQYIIENLELQLVYLIGNKFDKIDERKVKEEEAIEFAKKNNMRYFKISCKTNSGINELFEELCNEILLKIRVTPYSENKEKEVKSKKNKKKKKKFLIEIILLILK